MQKMQGKSAKCLHNFSIPAYNVFPHCQIVDDVVLYRYIITREKGHLLMRLTRLLTNDIPSSHLM